MPLAVPVDAEDLPRHNYVYILQRNRMDSLANPRLIDWAVTSRCNLSCRHCRGMPNGELTPDRAALLVSEIATLAPGWVIVEGGEPLLREDLYEILSGLRRHGLEVHLISNGLLLAPETVSRLKQLGVRLIISLDGAQAATYEGIRTGARFEKALAATRLAAASGILEALDMAVLRSNFGEIGKMFHLAQSLGTKLNLIGLKPCHRDQLGELLTQKEYLTAITAACRAGGETGAGFFFDEPFFHAVAAAEGLPVPAAAPSAGIGAPAAPGCIFGEYLFIETNGDVRPCSFAPMVMGNVKAKSLPEIWQEMQASSWLRDIKDPARRTGPCRVCRHITACGGCRSRTYLVTGDWLASDPACPYGTAATLKDMK
jgi:radical SAM protein with 4Fe4S-binding SPASM domain